MAIADTGGRVPRKVAKMLLREVGPERSSETREAA